MNNDLNPYPELNSFEKFRAALEKTNFFYYRNKDLRKCDEDRVHLLRMQHTAIKNGWSNVLAAYESYIVACENPGYVVSS